ncbi:multicopper oxidase family protein [Methylovulum psychrotolerans]|uniref:Bilirubin oxidase n=1 Tax=Methylovulum psychrotolerans TaxID=1704499 RepID=A0A2S5CI25_9GAMM|nr:multicopper oxidase domain-containing protein [Methylovulum psychrotolerans]POZ50454.1 bilirubin oxidase [Methylovulum psychrotolerans]
MFANNNNNYSRRRFLSHTGLGMLAFAGMPNLLQAMEGMQAMPKMPPRLANPQFKPDVEIELFCKPAAVAILVGQQTQVLQYTARLLQGPKDTLTEIAGSYLGPIIRLHKGQKVRILLHNGLSETTVTHWHGLHVPAEMDGHPLYAIASGEKLVYEFEVLNRAGLNIYHPHPHETTAKQVYHGLAGALVVNDDEEAALGLPSGDYEIPIVIQDRLFDAQNQLVYVRHQHDRMMGFYGDRILVNGKADFQLDVDSRAYRLRFMNGSTARIYKLGWDDGTPITVLGVDGGLLEQPETKPYMMLAPGERLDVWADFSGRPEGSQLVMRSLAFSGVLPSMGMMMQRGGLAVGSEYPIFTVKVTRKVSDSPKLPHTLAKPHRYAIADTANPNRPVPIAITEAHMAMLLNGRSYAYNDVQDSERIPVNTVQLMEIFHAHGGGMGMSEANPKQAADHQNGGMGMMGHGMGGMRQGGMGGSMGMMMSMAHPIHLHGQAFTIISRTIATGNEEHYATVRDGFIDNGLKDTVLVMPGETVRIIKPFQDFKGVFMYHCHNLEHEDMGMMRDFLVV